MMTKIVTSRKENLFQIGTDDKNIDNCQKALLQNNEGKIVRRNEKLVTHGRGIDHVIIKRCSKTCIE